MYFTKKILVKQLNDDHHLLINTLSGAVDIVDNTVWEGIQEILAHETDNPCIVTHLDSAVEARLRQRLYLFNTLEDEAQYRENLFMTMTQELRESMPLQFAICPTFSCNLRCTYCFEGDLTMKPVKIMTPEQVELAFQAIETIKSQVHSSSNAHVILFGGEPLLQPTYSCVEEVLKIADEQDYSVEVVTNGVQLGSFVDLFDKKRTSIGQIQVTIDGPMDIHNKRRMYKSGDGTFNKIVKNVEHLLEVNLPVNVRINVDQDNINHLPELIEFMEERGWVLYPKFSCYVYPVTAYNNPDKANLLHEDQLLYKLQRMFQAEGGALPAFALYGFKVLGHIASVLSPESISLDMPPLFTYCEANGLRYFAFGSDGYIYPCGQSVGQIPLAIGRYDPQLELWSKQCEMWANRSVMTMPQCQECAIATLCGGGCAYGAYLQTGSVSMPNCQNSKETLDAYLEHMKEHLVLQVL